METLSQLLQRLRKEKSLTQKDLAHLANLSLSSIEKFEEGSRQPTIQVLAHLAEVLEVDPVELFVVYLRSSGKDTVAPSESMRHEMEKELDAVFTYDSYFSKKMQQIQYLKEWATARILLLRFDAARAIPILGQIVEDVERGGGGREFQALTHIDLANAYTIGGEPESAAKHVTIAQGKLQEVERSGEASRERLNRVQVGKARAMLVEQEIAFLFGRDDECVRLHEQVKPFLGDDWETADHCGWAKTYYYLAWMRQHQRRFDEAKQYAQEGLKHARYEATSWWKTNPMWKVRDGVFLSVHWWRLSMTTLLLDILACDNRTGSSEFAECVMSYRQQRRVAFWTNDLPPFRSRYLWLDRERKPALLNEYDHSFKAWLVKSNNLGCQHLHTEILVSYGDFLRSGKKDEHAAKLIYEEVVKRSQERKYAFLGKLAEERLKHENLPFPWLKTDQPLSGSCYN